MQVSTASIPFVNAAAGVICIELVAGPPWMACLERPVAAAAATALRPVLLLAAGSRAEKRLAFLADIWDLPVFILK